MSVSRWIDPNPEPSPVTGFILWYDGFEVNFGMPTPNEDGIWTAHFAPFADGKTVTLQAYNAEGERSEHSNAKVIPEAGFISMMIAGLVLLALLWRIHR